MNIFEHREDGWYITGKFLFFMYDTYGMPPELVKRKLDELLWQSQDTPI